MERRQQVVRGVAHRVGVQQHEEVRSERVPVRLAHAGDGEFALLFTDGNADAVAAGHPVTLGPADLHRRFRRRAVGRPDRAVGQRVGRREAAAPAEVQRPVLVIVVALGFAGCRLPVLFRRAVHAQRRLAVDRDQAAGGHRFDAGIVGAQSAQRGQHAVTLFGLDVDQEVVWRIRRQPLAPLLQQARTGHRQQQQRAQRQRQPDQLHHRQHAAPGQRGQAQSPVAMQAVLQAAQPLQAARAGDQVPAALVAAPLPADESEHAPLSFAWALDPAQPLQAATPYASVSRSYWQQVDGTQLQRGLALPLTAADAVIQLSPAEGRRHAGG
ncbi:hypothetical protein G6F50_013243 [Rhizopus delemar]|uniref:DUF4785 domain-containing protein n=1 Tax=Rhizopus delemar TaxID=936053 RepID=A0A9P7CFT6_9FUNG|nr:hypothetical protein G6F50_013243 [Rhizopus delemar]